MLVYFEICVEYNLKCLLYEHWLHSDDIRWFCTFFIKIVLQEQEHLSSLSLSVPKFIYATLFILVLKLVNLAQYIRIKLSNTNKLRKLSLSDVCVKNCFIAQYLTVYYWLIEACGEKNKAWHQTKKLKKMEKLTFTPGAPGGPAGQTQGSCVGSML